MTEASGDHFITDVETLQRLYAAPSEASVIKEVDHLHPHYRAFIAAAPFCVLATHGPKGLDASPRGDARGFVEIADDHTLLLPDRRGNNRIDTLRNILHDPRVGLLFLIPGVGETLRVNGRARISVAPDLLERLAVDGKPPRSVLVVQVESVFFQCSRAVIRAELWNPERQVDRRSLPSVGTILGELSRARIDAAAYDQAMPERLRTTLY